MLRLSIILPALLLPAVALGGGQPVQTPEHRLEQQRAAFREAYAAAELGDWRPAADNEALLEKYVLWPDLRAAWLEATIDRADDAEIEDFLARHDGLRAARSLRYRYAVHLARSGRSRAFLEIYRAFYQGLGIPRLDCLAVHAEILSGNAAGVADRARALWLVGHSQVDECDPVFDYLRGAGLLTAAMYRERYELALSAGQYSLARYLARSLDDATLADAGEWLVAQRDPVAFLENEAEAEDIPQHRDRVIMALERIALKDAGLAEKYWQQVRERRRFPADARNEVARHIALWHARQHDPAALRKLNALPGSVVDDEVRRWQARSAMAGEKWDDVASVIAGMPADQRDVEEWRYWLATASLKTGETAQAEALLEGLSRLRSYYGFLAADQLARDYVWQHAAVLPDEAVLPRLEADPSFLRARELFYAGLESRGRSEWDDATAGLGHEEKVQAALLAHHWGWHSRAIATLAAAGQYDDLTLRYPLPWSRQFEKASASARIPSSWAYGVARSESLFIPDIRSRAGAIGIMQLMPSTGRRAAGQLDLPYRGLATLTDPESNIRLGTTYLGEMLQRFDDNRVVATAAYNAGPSRVASWLPESTRLDARIWIENIPFNETRDYVRRVLVSETIFSWRLTGSTWRLSDTLGSVAPAGPEVAGASP